ncbi:MAG: S1 RNA-binding domain-containing protein [Oscillospiraceae bacterium]|nr:S1 RNA-binding domain-containing protein [Oscillospiraceae bacterium]
MEFGVGSIVEGKVSSIKNFGAFVSLPEGKSGLVHISEISYAYVNDVHDLLSEGDTVKVKVIGIDDSGRINLSIKKTAPPPPRPKSSGRRERAPASPQSKEPPSFEDRLKQFMAASDSKLSDLRRSENRSSRRSGGRGRS